MGLQLGTARVNEPVLPFNRLSGVSMQKLLKAYYNYSDGFGVALVEMMEIFGEIAEDLVLRPENIRELAKELFVLLDIDHNQLVDGLELLSCLAVCSGMSHMEKMLFVLQLCDFGNKNQMSFDEVVLALKSAASGLCKLHDDQHTKGSGEISVYSVFRAPKDEEIEEIVNQVFRKESDLVTLTSSKNAAVEPVGMQTPVAAFMISLDLRDTSHIANQLLMIPEISSWLHYFSNIHQLPANYVSSIQPAAVPTITLAPSIEQEEFKVVNWQERAFENPNIPKNLQWQSQVALLTPGTESLAGSAPVSHVPSVRLQEEWIYGTNCALPRNVKYIVSGEIAYSAGKYGILYSSITQKQRIMALHDDAITCVRVSSDLRLVATGDAGQLPRVVIWSTDSLEVVYHSQGRHRGGIVDIAFSASHELLMSLDSGEENITVVISRWMDDTIVYMDRVYCKMPRACSFLAETCYVVAADRALHFWCKEHDGFAWRFGSFLRGREEEMTVLLPVNERMIAGCRSGKLLLWRNLNCIKEVLAHKQAVNDLNYCADGLVSAGDDSMIRLWSAILEPRFLFDVSRFGLLTAVTGVSAGTDGASIVFGTKGADIFEISSIDGADLRGGPLVKGHNTGELTALDVHPTKLEFLTAGTDCTVRVMDMKLMSLLRMAQVSLPISCACYSPLGDLIAMSTQATASKGATCLILTEENLSIIHTFSDSPVSATIMKYSREGETLAIGAVDGAIYLYSVVDDYELVAKCHRHQTIVEHIDFSFEGDWMRSNSIDGELFFFNADDGSFQNNVAAMRDVKWASQTCTLTWQTKAIHVLHRPERITSCNLKPLDDVEEQAEVSGPLAALSRPFLVTGSSLGQLRIVSYPCTDHSHESLRYNCHIRRIEQIKFSYDSSLLLSAGRDDRCVIQWRLAAMKDDLTASRQGATLPDELSFESLSDENVHKGLTFMTPSVPSAVIHRLSAPGGRDEYPWMLSAVPPSFQPAPDVMIQHLPDLSAALNHVYGYENSCLRNNLFCTNTGELVYSAGELGIVWSPMARVQKLFAGHRNVITAMASTQDGTIVASGELGNPNAQVAIWDTTSAQPLTRWFEPQPYNVVALAFSASTQLLAVAGNDVQHTVSVYDWRRGAVLNKIQAGYRKILGMCFYELDAEWGTCLATFGMRTLRLWRQASSRFYTLQTIDLCNIGKAQQSFLCCTIFHRKLVVGTEDGSVYVFHNERLNQAVTAHAGGVYAVHVPRHNKLLFTGGQDAVLRSWNADLECQREYKVTAAVRTIATNVDASKVYVGTQAGDIIELVTASDGSSPTELIKSHCVSVFALDAHPKQQWFVTAGDDALLRVWDSKKRSCARTIKLEAGSRAVAFSHEGNLLAVGLGTGRSIKGRVAAKEGAMVVFATDSLRVVHEMHDSRMAIRCLRFSPNGKVLAAGGEDNKIRLYGVEDQFVLRFTIGTHQASILRMDFSASGSFLMSQDTAERVHYTSAQTGQVAAEQDVQDESWVEGSVTMTFNMQSLWLSTISGHQPSATKRNYHSNSSLLAVANGHGELFIARQPLQPHIKAAMVHCGRHSAEITALAWLAKDTFLISASGRDCLLRQWRLMTAYDKIALQRLQLLANQNSRKHNDILRALMSNQASSSAGEDEQVHPGKCLPWTSMMCEPSNAQILLTEAMKNTRMMPKAEVQFVHGVSQSVRQSPVYYNLDNKLVYSVAHYGVIYDRFRHSQLLYTGHRCNITSLAISGDGRYMASGDQQPFSELHIWDSRTALRYQVFKDVHRHQIEQLAFSTDGRWLVSIGNDRNAVYSVNLFISPSGNWKDAEYMSSSLVTGGALTWLLLSNQRDFPIVCGGEDGVIHSFRPAPQTLQRRSWSLDTLPTNVSLPSACICALQLFPPQAAQTVLVLGASDGFLHFVAQDDTLITSHSAYHHIAVRSLFPVHLHNQHSLFCLGADMVLKQYTSALEMCSSLNLSSCLPAAVLHGSVCLPRMTIALTLSNGDLVELTLLAQKTVSITESSVARESHAMALHPTLSQVVTADDEGVIRVWSFASKQCLRRRQWNAAVRAIGYSPDASVLVIGCGSPHDVTARDGLLAVLHAEDLQTLREQRKARQHITDIQFTAQRNDQFICCAADGRAYVVETMTLLTLVTIETDARLEAWRVDVSDDWCFARLAMNKGYMLHYGLISQAIETNPIVTKDVSWSSSSCVYDWATHAVIHATAPEVDGVSLPHMKGVHVTAAAVHKRRQLQAVALRDGRLFLSVYPTSLQLPTVPLIALPSVPSFASRLAFSSDGRLLLALDTHTGALVQLQL